MNFLYYLTESANIVVDEISFLYKSNACVDEHTCDQLLIYMALASGRSQILCAPVCDKSSLHIETVIKMATDLSGVVFNIEEVEQTVDTPDSPSYKCRLVTCEGI
jgi:RNA 3'-terminal phosphate cyclase (ATP)